jgi:hypothetical protein
MRAGGRRSTNTEINKHASRGTKINKHGELAAANLEEKNASRGVQGASSVARMVALGGMNGGASLKHGDLKHGDLSQGRMAVAGGDHGQGGEERGSRRQGWA